MSVVRATEITDGRRAEQEFRGSAKTARVFDVRVDDPAEPLVNIANACGIQWLDPHPEFPIYCVGIQPENVDGPLTYRVTFKYDLVRPQDRVLLPWQRPVKVSYDGSLTSGPLFIHYNEGNDTPKILTNTAGDPIEGLTRDEAEWVANLELNSQTFDKAKARQYLNAVNSDVYSDSPAGTVKCQRIAGSLEIENIQGEEVVFWKVTAVLAYREVGWATRVPDVGFNEIVTDRQGNKQRSPILDVQNQPVAQPVALRNGVRMTGNTLSTSGPDILTFKGYKSHPFTGTFPALP